MTLRERYLGLAALIGMTPRELTTLALILLGISQILAIVGLSGQLLLLHVIDGVMETGNLNTLEMLLGIFLLVQAIGIVIRIEYQKIIRTASAVADRKLFLRCMHAAVYLSRTGQADLAFATLSDMSTMRSFIAGSAVADGLALFMLPMPFWFLYLFSPILAAIGILALVSIIGINLYSLKVNREPMKQAAGLLARANATLARHLQRRDEVLGLGLLPGIVRHWLPQRREALELEEVAADRSETLSSLSGATTKFFFVVITTTTTYLVNYNLSSPGVFIASFIVFARLVNPVEVISSRWSRWSQALVAMERLHETAASMPTEVVTAPEVEAEGLDIIGLSLTIPGRDVALVTNLNMHVPPGTVVAVTGRNGSGKSTLMRALVGLVTPAGGAAVYRGWPMHLAERAVIGPQLGYLGQRVQLLRGSIMDNIGRFTGDTAGALEAARLVGAHTMIGRLTEGYDTDAGAGTLSGGQQRLVALARAVYGNPGLVLLDEPEVGLDAPTLAALVPAVVELRRRGAIVFLVTHDMSRWRDTADMELQLLGGGRYRSERVEPQPALQPNV